MQARTHADEVEDDCGHDHGDGHHHHHHHGGRQVARLYLIFVGASFIIASFLSSWLFPQEPLAADVSAAVGAFILAFPIIRTAIRDILDGEMHMDELVAIAVLACMVQGDFQTAGIVSFFMLFSLVIETGTAQGAHQAIEGLVRLTPKVARRVGPSGEQEIAVSALAVGDVIQVRPGEMMPADGVILDGVTTLNEATITGESLPRDKRADADVFAGTENLTGVITVRVSRVGKETTLGRVKELILAAEGTKLPFMRIVDRYLVYYTPTVLMLAAMLWFFTDNWTKVIAFLIVCCPCALIVATPTAMVAALSSASRLGTLIKNVNDLESAARIDAIVFDKTGTLTYGELGVVRLAPQPDVPPSRLLRLAASAERYSKHPAGRAMVALAGKSHVEVSEPADVQEQPGLGVSARIDGNAILCGRSSWLASMGVDAAVMTREEQGEQEGLSVIHVASDGHYLGWIGMRDQIRAEAKSVLAELKELGIREMAMVTGDREPVARRVAQEVDGLKFQAGCLPHEKTIFVEQMKKSGRRVAFVGDGVNDAPALAASDIGIAMGAAGSDVAIHSATVALMSSDLRRLPFLIRLSRAVRSVVFQNLAVGLFFILIGISLAALGLMTPIMATLLHNAGSLIVVFNSARLVRIGSEPAPMPIESQQPAPVAA